MLLWCHSNINRSGEIISSFWLLRDILFTCSGLLTREDPPGRQPTTGCTRRALAYGLLIALIRGRYVLRAPDSPGGLSDSPGGLYFAGSLSLPTRKIENVSTISQQSVTVEPDDACWSTGFVCTRLVTTGYLHVHVVVHPAKHTNRTMTLDNRGW